MKNYLFAAALLLAVPTAHAQDKTPKPSLKALDEKNGFRNYHFGDDISQFQDLKVVEDDGDSKFYSSTNENLKVGGADLKDITYGFYKGKLANVFIKTPGLTDSRALLDALKAQYGRPFQPNQFMQRYSWLGKNVYLNYDENSIDGTAKVYMTSEAIRKQQQADEKDAAKKASKDL